LRWKLFSNVKVFDLKENEFAPLVNEQKAKEEYPVNWNEAGSTVVIYFYKMQIGWFSETGKMQLLE
jgi:hypothetical protein